MCDTAAPGSGIDLPDLTTSSLATLYNSLLSNDTVFRKYTLHNLGGTPVDFNGTNYVQNACALQYSKIENFLTCNESLIGENNRTVIYDKLMIRSSTDEALTKIVNNQLIAVSVAVAVCAILVVVSLAVYCFKKKQRGHAEIAL